MSNPSTYKIKGMHCASCAINIEKKISKEEGVSHAEVNYGTESLKVSFDPEKTNPDKLSKAIAPLGYSLEMPEPPMTHEMMGMSADEHANHGPARDKRQALAALEDMRRGLTVVLPLAAFSALVMGWDIAAEFGALAPMTPLVKEFVHHLLPIFATYTLFVTGLPYLKGLARFFRYGAANMDTLIGLGTVAAYLYSFAVSAFEGPLAAYVNVKATYYDVTIIVIAFIALGKYLESRSKLRTGDAIEKLLVLQAKTALIVRDGKEIEIPVEQVVVGDVIVVKPAGRIPVDGTVIDGESYVDESVVTGEPMAVKKAAGDTVVSGTMNTSGSFTFRATKVGADTMLSRIITMVQEAQGSRAPIQALADRISAVFVPTVLVIAFVSLAAWLILGTRAFGFPQALSYGLTCFVGVLVIACPCALGLATPTAIIVGVGKGAREGILIKDAATLELLHKVDTVVMDKTGTLTKGKPEVTAIRPVADLKKEDVLAVLAALEARSEHPIAHAITAHAKATGVTVPNAEKFEALKGRGVKGTVHGTEYWAGNAKLMESLGLAFDYELLAQDTAAGNTPVLLATEKEIVAAAVVSDALRDGAAEAVAALKKMGIRTVMLTGDDAKTAAHVAELAGVDEVIAEVLPEQKLEKIVAMQKRGRIVAMAGDGVNDAPALAKADVGIAMATGTDVAIESAGITLLHGDVTRIVKAIRLSRLTMRGIRQNLFWAFAYNVVGIPLAAGAFYPSLGLLLNPVFAGLAMAFSSVSVVGNSLRLKNKKL